MGASLLENIKPEFKVGLPLGCTFEDEATEINISGNYTDSEETGEILCKTQHIRKSNY